MTFSINDRRLIEGPRNDLMQVRPIKHQFAREMLDIMMDNTWFPQEIDLSEDAKMFATGAITESETDAYRKALAFLSNLDGIQLTNLVTNINPFVTSPEVNMCLVRQAWEEALHVESYAIMIETIGFDPIEVYWMFERDGLLAAKNEHILKQSRVLGNDFSPENFALALVANIVLEGVYFYSGFLVFYTLARMGKMKQSAKMIKMINRDELVHLHLFVNMWHTLRAERPEIFTTELYERAKAIVRSAVELESTWGRHIISGGVLGLNDQIVDEFVQYLADERLKSIGISPLYGVVSPVPWFDQFANVNDSEENFFEAKVSNYNAGGALDW
jgi:ribonucleoside-diphosphate reductase beta chain